VTTGLNVRVQEGDSGDDDGVDDGDVNGDYDSGYSPEVYALLLVLLEILEQL
jgi:hypothetical protein